MRFQILLLICILGLLEGGAVGEDGMWRYTAVPKAQIKTKYGFEVTDPWLKHLQLSSIRFKYGSGAFVSADGLILTNHHVASDCLHSLSTAAHDYLKTGFYANTNELEPACTDLQLNVHEQATDVISQGNADAQPGA